MSGCCVPTPHTSAQMAVISHLTRNITALSDIGAWSISHPDAEKMTKALVKLALEIAQKKPEETGAICYVTGTSRATYDVLELFDDPSYTTAKPLPSRHDFSRVWKHSSNPSRMVVRVSNVKHFRIPKNEPFLVILDNVHISLKEKTILSDISKDTYVIIGAPRVCEHLVEGCADPSCDAWTTAELNPFWCKK